MIKNLVVVLIMAILAVLVSGCMNAPVKEAKAPDKYVEINLINGEKVGGKYLNESAAFTKIIPMYLISESGTMQRGNGKEVAIKSSIITSMITIDDPSAGINATIEKQDAEMKAYKAKRAAEDAALAAENAKKTQHA